MSLAGLKINILHFQRLAKGASTQDTKSSAVYLRVVVGILRAKMGSSIPRSKAKMALFEKKNFQTGPRLQILKIKFFKTTHFTFSGKIFFRQPQKRLFLPTVIHGVSFF